VYRIRHAPAYRNGKSLVLLLNLDYSELKYPDPIYGYAVPGRKGKIFMVRKKHCNLQQGACSSCAYLEYDEDYEEYLCSIDMDEDDWVRVMESSHGACPYYRNGDEYAVVRHQI
jgi:hypothetical protein